jgi:hypothetical protein
VCRWVERSPRFWSCVGTSTMAPAASPKRMQVLRSFQLVTRVRTSTPTTRAARETPVQTKRSATARA